MKRAIYILLGLAVLLPTALLIYLRYGFAADEGYSSWEAVRNFLVRDGEIVIRLPDGVKVVSASCDDSNGNVRVDGQTVTTKIGYTWCTISIETEQDGRPDTLHFHPQKLNNWNRMIFIPSNPNDPQSQFLKFENGIEKSHADVTRESSSQQESSGRAHANPESN